MSDNGICRYGNNCGNEYCVRIHTGKPIECRYGNSCRFGRRCLFGHPEEMKGPESRCVRGKDCRFGSKCASIHTAEEMKEWFCSAFPACEKGDKCEYSHDIEKDITLCKFGKSCGHYYCGFYHSARDREYVNDDPSTTTEKCPYGINCPAAHNCSMIHIRDSEASIRDRYAFMFRNMNDSVNKLMGTRNVDFIIMDDREFPHHELASAVAWTSFQDFIDVLESKLPNDDNLREIISAARIPRPPYIDAVNVIEYVRVLINTRASCLNTLH